jgi:hypothetical protein
MTQHSKSYPPSSAARYINCPGSVSVAHLYPNYESDASLAGDAAHQLLEDGIRFGLRPVTDDPDTDENIERVLDWVDQRRREYGPGCVVYAEQRLEIPETGEFGTADIIIVTLDLLEIGDYKNGYVLVETRDKHGALNEQLMTYLLGAIAKYGERDRYAITVHQPNASHIDGPARTATVSRQDVLDFRERTLAAVGSRDFIAGPWCKKTYCDHRGSCASFQTFALENPEHTYDPAEINAIDDARLGSALDRSDVVHGYRDELRKEAIRRFMQLDRKIPGYKMVKGRRDREFINPDEIAALCKEMFNATDARVYSTYNFETGKYTVRTVKGIEDFVKKECRSLGRGKWIKVWEEHFKPRIREHAGGLTLERATDARPAHSRGSEFGSFGTPLSQTMQTAHTISM